MSVVWRDCMDQPTTRREMEEDQETISGIVFPTIIDDPPSKRSPPASGCR